MIIVDTFEYLVESFLWLIKASDILNYIEDICK